MRRYTDRTEAGQLLARHLRDLDGRDDVIVMALPRGGVPVAFEVAQAIHAPLDVLVVRKIGAPHNEELAIGAIATGGLLHIDHGVVQALGITPTEIARVRVAEERELLRREQLYRRGRSVPDLAGHTVVLVDDGLATGSTMQVAVMAVRRFNPRQVIVAVPAATREACERMADLADRCVCDSTPEPFYGVGMWYEDFSQTTDDEVIALLERSERTQATAL